MKYILQDFKKAIVRFEEALDAEKTDMNRDSCIKRFELCFDLSWKLIKAYAKRDGVECYSPRSCFRVGFQLGVIENDPKFMKMVESRNKSVHVYHEEYADALYKILPEYKALFHDILCGIERGL